MSARSAARAIVEFGVPIPMRDGTILRADIIRPQTDHPVPVILMRNPYQRIVARQHLDQIRAVESGFAVVAQSVRGAAISDGDFVPWRHEVTDGRDSIDWCAAQPWSSGSVGTFGGSYLGQVQLFAAMANPPSLRAMVPFVVPSDPYRMQYEGGAFLLGSALDWAWGRAGDRIARLRMHAPSGELDEDWEHWLAANESVDDLFRTTPLRAVPLLGKYFPQWVDWMDHPTHDEWWAQFDLGPRPALPTIMVTGWWDLFLRETLVEWNRQPRSPESRLVIGPWSHAIDGEAHGDIHYGRAASASAQDVMGLALDYLGHHLASAPVAEGPRVRVFVMGANRWRDEDTWPPSGVRERRFFLRHGGLLTNEPPGADEAPALFAHDPADPVPTVGGRNLMPGNAGAHLTGPAEQARLDGRRDLLRFTSARLTGDVTIIGPLTATLHAATTAADTDWTAKLVDVWPDGRSYHVADGIIRARFSSGAVVAQPREPGAVTAFRIDLASTAFVFLAGHRIRVEVSSSNFPRFDRNPGTGGSSADTPVSDFVTARQTVFLDAGRASWIELPVLEQSG